MQHTDEPGAEQAGQHRCQCAAKDGHGKVYQGDEYASLPEWAAQGERAYTGQLMAKKAA